MKKISEMTPEEKTEAIKTCKAKVVELQIKFEIIECSTRTTTGQMISRELEAWERALARLQASL